MNSLTSPRGHSARSIGLVAASPRPIRVVTADDSALIRLTLDRHLGQYSDVEVVGQAKNGRDLLSLVEEIKPDVVVSDVEMPEMNGLDALNALMRTRPLPVIMLSNLTSEGAEVTLQALEAGAFDFVVKPQPGTTMAETVKVLVEKVRCAAHSSARRGTCPPETASGPTPHPAPVYKGRAPQLPLLRNTDTLLAVASSTGGPTALTKFLSSLPPDLPIGGVIVQHMPVGFTTLLSERLNKITGYSVREAQEGDQIRTGQFLVAPGGKHMLFNKTHQVLLSEAPSVNGVRPAADVTMKSLAPLFRERVLAVVLTGMGQDGFAGAKTIQQAGGRVIAQDQESCVVYGMPRHVVEANLVEAVGSPEQLGWHVGERVSS